jgi:hypothetical protein
MKKKRIIRLKEAHFEKIGDVKKDLDNQNITVEGSVDEIGLIFTGEVEEEEINPIKENPFIEGVEDDDRVSGN